MDEISFTVFGRPVPKQSFRVSRKGGYTDPRVTAWQNEVTFQASLAMAGQSLIEAPVSVYMEFWLPDRTRRDVDNLSKAVNDALNGVVWEDDSQIERLTVVKTFNKPHSGVHVFINELSKADEVEGMR